MVSPIEVVCFLLLACESQEHFQKCFLFTNVLDHRKYKVLVMVICASCGGPRRALAVVCHVSHHWRGGTECRGGCAVFIIIHGGRGHLVPRRSSCSIVVHGVRHGIIALQSLHTTVRRCLIVHGVQQFHHSIIPSFHHSIIPSFISSCHQ